MKEVYPGIYEIKEKGPFGAFTPEVNVYVLAGGDGLIFDAGYGTRSSVAHFLGEIEKIKKLYESRALPFAIRRILPSHTHPDHVSGLLALRLCLNLRILLTERMARVLQSRESYYSAMEYDDERNVIRRKEILRRIVAALERVFYRSFYRRMSGLEFIPDPDEIISAESTISINGDEWTIFPSPGHESDHISLYCEKKGILLCGDNILRTITTWLGPPDSDIEDYITSLEYIAALPNLKLALSAHGSPITNPRERIREIIDYRKARIAQVREIIKKHADRGITVDALMKELYARDGRFKKEMARGWVLLTLDYCEKHALARRVKERGIVRYYPGTA